MAGTRVWFEDEGRKAFYRDYAASKSQSQYLNLVSDSWQAKAFRRGYNAAKHEWFNPKV